MGGCIAIASLALISALFGIWRGDSTCVANRTSCRDETAVYRIAPIPGQPRHVSIDGGKVVNGQVISMGVLAGVFDDASQSLVSTYQFGSLRLTLRGDRLAGTLSTPAGLVIRRISLTRSSQVDPDPPSVTTAQYDNFRTGANVHETILKPQNVRTRTFGKLFKFDVDGDVYAQPLYLSGRLFVATEHGSVYAFRAAGKPRAPLWRATLGPAVPSRDLNCPFIRPEVGITPTPVIDARSGTIYVVARTKEARGYVQRLHALDIGTGREKFGGPVVLTAPGFDSLRENPRAALLLTDGNVYIAWASSCDVPPYHGWVMSYDAHSLKQTGALNLSPRGEAAGIWQSQTGLASDGSGRVYAATGNGTFDAASGGPDYGDSVIAMRLSPHGLAIVDSFTPFDQVQLDSNDLDLGAGGPLLLPDQSGRRTHELVVQTKSGAIYVLNRDALGGFHAGSNAHAAQVILAPGGNVTGFGAPAYWNGRVYSLLGFDAVKSYAVSNGQLALPPARGSQMFTDPGATPAISANGSEDGIVWLLETKSWRGYDRPAVLHAYDATDVTHELYSSEQNQRRDRAGLCLRFTIPTVINGRVYVGAKREVDVYGLVA